MNNYREIFRSFALRGILGLPFFVGGVIVLHRAHASPDPGSGFLGCALIIAAAVTMAGPVARLIAEPAGNLFYPNRSDGRRQPAYSISESKRAKGLYEEAIAGFEQIASEFPDEVKPYIHIIDICIRNLKDPARANEVFQRGLASLKKEEERETLARMYSGIRTRLNSKPSN
jgi:hypothetical protein